MYCPTKECHYIDDVRYMCNACRNAAEATTNTTFTIKDSGERQYFDSGMVRDTTSSKVNYLKITEGPMLERWAAHLTKGAIKYPDVKPGVANWTLADGEAELNRFRESALRHLLAYLRGDTDEDHAAATFFNINGAEYVKGKINEKNVPSGESGLSF